LLQSYNGQRGYVYSDYLSKTKYTWTDVTLRSYPSAESNPVTIIPPKSIVQVLSVNGDWSRAMYDDQEGYIFSYFLSDDGNFHTSPLNLLFIISYESFSIFSTIILKTSSYNLI